MVIGCDPKVAGDYEIDNYFGFENTITGRELIERGRRQASRFGTEIRCEKVLGIHHGDTGGFNIKTDHGQYHACAVILATGVSRARPKIPGSATMRARGFPTASPATGISTRANPSL